MASVVAAGRGEVKGGGGFGLVLMYVWMHACLYVICVCLSVCLSVCTVTAVAQKQRNWLIARNQYRRDNWPNRPPHLGFRCLCTAFYRRAACRIIYTPGWKGFMWPRVHIAYCITLYHLPDGHISMQIRMSTPQVQQELKLNSVRKFYIPGYLISIFLLRWTFLFSFSTSRSLLERYMVVLGRILFMRCNLLAALCNLLFSGRVNAFVLGDWPLGFSSLRWRERRGNV